MLYSEFIERVRDLTDLDQDQATRITQATLETLGERIYRTTRDGLASQLPDQLKAMLHARTEPETSRKGVDRFSLDELYHRISARSEISYPQTVPAVKTVFMVLQQAVTEGAWHDLLAELPAEYDEFIG